MLPRNNLISENGTACKPTHSTSVRRVFDQSGGIQSPQKGEKKKSVHRLGTKPEDLAEYGNKDGSVIDIRNPESLDKIPLDKKIIINSNLSSRENPLSSRSDFVSIYSETIGRSLPPTVPERKSYMKYQSRNSATQSVRGSHGQVINNLGTKSADLALYGNKDGSVIDIRNPESLDEIPVDKKIIINTNLSSEGNPFSSRLTDFESVYSGTSGQSFPSDVPEKKADVKFQSRANSPTKCSRGSQGESYNNLGTTPEDLAQYGNKVGSVIDIRNPESLDEIPVDKKIIINSNLSSEGNPFAFVSAYSETIGQSIPPAVPEKKPDVKFHSRTNSPAKCSRGSQGQFCNILGRNAETVLAEYTNESNTANLDSSKKQCHVLPGNANACSQSMPRNMNDNTRNASPFQSESSRKKDIQPMNNPRNPMPASSTPQKTVERIGSKPEDLAQYGSKRDPKFKVLNFDAFEEMNPEEIADRRIILNTNLSSEGNPMSGKNLQPHPPKSGH